MTHRVTMEFDFFEDCRLDEINTLIAGRAWLLFGCFDADTLYGRP